MLSRIYFSLCVLLLLFSDAAAQSRSACAVLYNAQDAEIAALNRIADAMKTLDNKLFFDREANELTRRMATASDEVSAARKDYVGALERYAHQMRAYQRLLEECSTGPTR